MAKKSKTSPKSKPAARTIEKALDSVLDVTSARAKKPQTLNFYQRVYELVEQIPLGKVTTYGAIAETLGMKGSSRMVGHSLNALPEGSDLPAQRVINRIGALSGAHHFGGYDRMRRQLEREGVHFKGELVDMKQHFWHPKELKNDLKKELKKE